MKYLNLKLAALWSALLVGLFALRQRAMAGDQESSQRGDVPGWVLVTLMTALIVAALLAIAIPLLTGLFTKAVDTVK